MSNENELLGYYCEHPGNGSIELVLWKDAADRYAALGYAITPLVAAPSSPVPVEAVGWQPIDTVPKDGTYVDLWVSDHRATDVRWSPIEPDEYGFDHAWINSAGDFVVGEDEEALYWMRVERPAAPAHREVGG